MIDWSKHPHRRRNPLTGEWTLVSPQRLERPWQGRLETTTSPAAVTYDPACYLCPSNKRAGNKRNPEYSAVFVFDNDFPALRSDTPAASLDRKGLLSAQTERGICRVVCFSPRHDLTISRMDVGAITVVVDTWCEQYRALGDLPFIDNVQIFENRGEMMGASNPHPHCQIWANQTTPNEVVAETAAQSAYKRENGSCLLCDYLALERGSERMVCENESFIVVVPFWAIWPFETLVIGKRHTTGWDELSPTERTALADILRQITIRYDNLFEMSFPYSMGFHQRPTDLKPYDFWHLHAHYYPPLLRSASIKKFMVGYELLAGPQRDLTPESAAEKLRTLSPIRYSDHV